LSLSDVPASVITKIYFRYDWLLREFQFNTREVFSLNHFHMLVSYLILPPHKFLENWSSEIIIRDCSNKLESGNETFFRGFYPENQPELFVSFEFYDLAIMACNFWIFYKHWPLGSPEHKLPQKTPISFYDLFICSIFKKNPDPKKKLNWLSFGITKYIYPMNLERTADVTFFQNYLYTCNNVGTCRCKSSTQNTRR